MKRTLSVVLACVLMLSMLSMTALAADNEHKIELQGSVSTGILAVIVVPTSTTFVYDFEATSWNKIISPEISVTNNGVSAMNLSLIAVDMQSPNSDIDLVQATPADAKRELRIAFAPDISHSAITDVSAYLLDTAITSAAPIALTDASGIAGAGGKGTYRLFGDISAMENWVNEETFTLDTTLKVSVVTEP